MRSWGRSLWAGAAAIAILAAAAPGHGAGPARVAFTDRGTTLALTTSAYRLTLNKRNGKIVGLIDRSSGLPGTPLLRNTNRCLWGASADSNRTYVGGCSFAPRATRRFSYRWNAAVSTLTLDYSGASLGHVVVKLHAQPSFVDLRLQIVNRGHVLSRVEFPEALAGDTATVAAGYAPSALPGVRLVPAFFSRIGNDVQLYPSRWAFADYLALDVGDAHLSVYSISRGPLSPVQLGFIHAADPAPCSGPSYCLVHEFQTWVKRGTTWTSPTVRVRVGDTTEQSILAYRHDNGIDKYPSLQSKLGPSLGTYAEAPLLKANLPLIRPFRDWASELQRLPSPLLLHPAAFQAGGFDMNVPDLLPPDPRFGTEADFSAMIAAAHRLGDLVMPYGNLSWWDPASPTMRGVNVNDVAVLDPRGDPQTVSYGDHTGVIVSPYSPLVRQRIERYFDEWRTTIPADCIFLDQLGARPWLRDFNPASPTPIAYDDGWLDLLARKADHCVMVEDGWDRLADTSVAFHGSLLMMSRELDLPNAYFGAGNWQPYPLAVWLFHDKVLMYQHDLYDATMANDLEVLTWNMAFGMVNSYSWDKLGPDGSPWLDLVARLQRDFGPHYVGIPLTRYSTLAPGVTESSYGDLDVIANRAPSGYSVNGNDLAPGGFLARTATNNLLAGAFEGSFDSVPLSPGVHYLIFERTATSVTVSQPVGADTNVAVVLSGAGPLIATALARDGAEIGSVAVHEEDGHLVFPYAGTLNGRAVAAYRVTH